MLNLPAYSEATLLALLLADLLVLLLFFIAVGPVLIIARDAFNRPIQAIGVLRRLALMALTLFFAGYLAVQGTLLWRFLPYYVDNNATAVELITAKIAYPDDQAPLAYWIRTQTHRFGVTSEIFRNVRVGDRVSFRYRPSDDVLYQIDVVQYANQVSNGVDN